MSDDGRAGDLRSGVGTGRRGPTRITLDRFGALDLRVDTKPDLTPVTDADEAVEAALRDVLAARAARRRGPRRGVRRHGGFAGTAVGDRPDRRHQELRPRSAGVGQPDRAAGGRRADRRRGQRPRAGPAVVGRARAGRLRRRSATRRRDGCRCPAVADLGSASLSFSSLSRVGRSRAARAVRRPDRRGVAGPRLRRLLLLLPGGRGCGRHRRRTGGQAVGPRAAGHPGARGRRRVHQPGRRRRARTAAARWRPTACCTTRCWPGCPACDVRNRSSTLLRSKIRSSIDQHRPHR